MKYRQSWCIAILLINMGSSLSASSLAAYDNQTIYKTTNHVFSHNDIAQGFVRLNDGFTVMPSSCVTMDTVFSVSGGIDLRETSTIRLLKDLKFDSGVTLTTGGNIDGRGHTLILNGDFRIPANKVLHFNGDTILDARGHEIVIGENAEIFVDTNVTLTIANATVKTTHNVLTYPAIRCGAINSKLALNNVTLAPADDFWFPRGQLFVHNDVVITGTSVFIYQSPMPSFITKNSCLFIDHAVTFSITPATFTEAPYTLNNTYTECNFIKMADKTSQLYLNGCVLQTTNTGLRITKGSVLCDDHVNFKTDPSPTIDSLAFQTQASFGWGIVMVKISPNGRFIAIGGPSPSSIYHLQVYRFDGTSLTLIPDAQVAYTDSYHAVNAMDWSPDGKYLLIAGEYPNTGYHIQCYSFNETSLTLVPGAQLYYGVAGNAAYTIKWSPDGKFFAYAGSLLTPGGKIYVYAFDGTNAILKSSTVYGHSVYSLDWSPDGNFLAVGGFSPGAAQVYRFNGTTLSLLTQVSYGSYVLSVNWSPDGRYLAISGYGPTSGYNIQIYRFYGASLIFQTQAGNATSRCVEWSPCGHFLSAGSDSSESVYSFDGSSLTSIATGVARNVYTATWSPDERFIATGSWNSGILEVYKVNYRKDIIPQALTNSLVLGDSVKGSDYDAHLRLLPGASINLSGKMLYDNIDDWEAGA